MEQDDTSPMPFPRPRQCPFHPPREYAEARDRPGLRKVTLWNGSEAWFVARHAEFRAALRDQRFSADTRHPNFPHLSAGMSVARGEYRAFVSMDAPQHTLHRRMLTKEFSKGRAEQQRGDIEQIVRDLLDDFTRDGRTAGDFFKEVALPLPSRVICQMLGVPYEAHEFFESRAEMMVSAEATVEQVRQASRELIDEYLGGLVAEKAKAPQDDILSMLATGPLARGELTLSELLAMARLLLVGGHETTANTAALGLTFLLQHPDQLRLLREDPGLTKGAVEEILRFVNPAHSGRRRVALEDVEVGGQLVRAGEAIVAHNPTADRDPEVYPDPDRFDITREIRTPAVFGDGIHVCLGQHLARLELEILFRAVVDRLPNLRLAVPLEELEFLDFRVVYGLRSLPVAWDPAPAG